MKTDYFHHYAALDLRPGASQKEVHSAFRSLAKRYHPDQDSSAYAEMRYKEARDAYDALRHKAKARPETGAAASASPPQPSPPPNTDYRAAGKDYGTVYGKGWWYVEDDEEEENPPFDFSELMWEYGMRKRPKKRLPFSLDNLPEALRVSFNEVFGIGMTIRVFLTVWALWATLTWVGWSGVWKVSTILCILLGGLLFRYYFPCPRQLPTSNIVSSLLCSVALSFLCKAATKESFAELLIVIFFCLSLLWASPWSWDTWNSRGS